jgi:hypothetical protein
MLSRNGDLDPDLLLSWDNLTQDGPLKALFTAGHVSPPPVRSSAIIKSTPANNLLQPSHHLPPPPPISIANINMNSTLFGTPTPPTLSPNSGNNSLSGTPLTSTSVVYDTTYKGVLSTSNGTSVVMIPSSPSTTSTSLSSPLPHRRVRPNNDQKIKTPSTTIREVISLVDDDSQEQPVIPLTPDEPSITPPRTRRHSGAMVILESPPRRSSHPSPIPPTSVERQARVSTPMSGTDDDVIIVISPVLAAHPNVATSSPPPMLLDAIPTRPPMIRPSVHLVADSSSTTSASSSRLSIPTIGHASHHQQHLVQQRSDPSPFVASTPSPSPSSSSLSTSVSVSTSTTSTIATSPATIGSNMIGTVAQLPTFVERPTIDYRVYSPTPIPILGAKKEAITRTPNALSAAVLAASGAKSSTMPSSTTLIATSTPINHLSSLPAPQSSESNNSSNSSSNDVPAEMVVAPINSDVTILESPPTILINGQPSSSRHVARVVPFNTNGPFAGTVATPSSAILTSSESPQTTTLSSTLSTPTINGKSVIDDVDDATIEAAINEASDFSSSSSPPMTMQPRPGVHVPRGAGAVASFMARQAPPMPHHELLAATAGAADDSPPQTVSLPPPITLASVPPPPTQLPVVTHSFYPTSSPLSTSSSNGRSSSSVSQRRLPASVNTLWLSRLRDGSKKIESRVATGQWATLIVNDQLTFNNELHFKVVAVRRYPSFAVLLENEGLVKVLPGNKPHHIASLFDTNLI